MTFPGWQAGPLRAAARDLSNRIKEIMRPTLGAEDGDGVSILGKDDYFSGHYLTDPEMSVDSTLYRLCKYLFWVNQLATHIHTGVSSRDDERVLKVGGCGRFGQTDATTKKRRKQNIAQKDFFSDASLFSPSIDPNPLSPSLFNDDRKLRWMTRGRSPWMSGWNGCGKPW